MKITTNLLMVGLIITAMMFSLCVPVMAGDSDIITFSDLVLENAVRANISKPTGDILRSDVSSIRAIMLETERVSNLQGIQALTSLGSLKITDSQLSDLSPLSGLPIYWLDMSNNQISDISVLANFTGLEFAYMKNNHISSVAPLMGLSKLAEVEFTGNPVNEASVRSLPCSSIKYVASVVVEATPTVAPTATPVVVITPEPTVAPTSTPVPTLAPTATPVVVVTPEPTVAPTSTPEPTATPVVVVTPEPTVAPTSTPEPTVTPVATEVPIATPTIDQTTPAALTVIDPVVVVKNESKVKEPVAKSTPEKIISLTVDSNAMKVNGSSAKIDEQGSAPVVVDGRTVLPIRSIVEALGGKITWVAEKKLVTVEFNGTKIDLVIDDTNARVNGETKILDVPAMIRSNRTYVPLRFVAENLGCTIKWDAATKGIVISY